MPRSTAIAYAKSRRGGHTPLDAVDFRTDRINLDVGAYRSGRLAVLKVDAAGPQVLDA